MKNLIFIATLLTFSIAFSHAQIITTVAGNGVNNYSGDGGPASTAEISPNDIAFDNSGNMYIADYGNYRIREVTSSGIISTIAGNGIYGYSGNGGLATNAEMYYPLGITIDGSNNIYFSEYQPNSIICKISSGFINLFAGIPLTSSFSGDGGPATDAELDVPALIAVDASGNLYIADQSNNVIREVNTSGIISTYAGNYSLGAGYNGEGIPASNAQLSQPSCIAIDGSGNLYIGDVANHLVRKVDNSPNHIISTYAGVVGVSNYSGDGGSATVATIAEPSGLAVDNLGDLYIADETDQVVREVNTSGIISTVAGNYSLGAGYNGDGIPATNAELNYPIGVAIYGTSLYIADGDNYRIRKVTNIVSGINPLPNSSNLLIYPNPAQDEIYVQLTGNEKVELIEMYSVTGQKILEQKLNTQYSILNTSSIPNGIYFLKVQMKDGTTVVKKVEILK